MFIPSAIILSLFARTFRLPDGNISSGITLYYHEIIYYHVHYNYPHFAWRQFIIGNIEVLERFMNDGFMHFTGIPLHILACVIDKIAVNVRSIAVE